MKGGSLKFFGPKQTFFLVKSLGGCIPSRRRLRSASSLQLDVPRTHRRTVGDRAFAAAGPTLWNSLPRDITDCVSLASFCRKLKTICFLYHFHDFIFLVILDVFTYVTLKNSYVCMYEPTSQKSGNYAKLNCCSVFHSLHSIYMIPWTPVA